MSDMEIIFTADDGAEFVWQGVNAVEKDLIGDGSYGWAPIDKETCTREGEHLLRFDPRYGLPVAKYCVRCGEDGFHPFHGKTDEEIAAAKKRGHEIWLKLNGYSSDSEVCLKTVPRSGDHPCGRPVGHDGDCWIHRRDEDEQ